MLGRIIFITNILPFGYLLLPFGVRRYNFLHMNMFGHRRFHYKQIWFRLIFGRFQYLVYGFVITYSVIASYKQSNILHRQYLDFGAFTNDYGEFDEEEHPHARHALVKYLLDKRRNDYSHKLREERGQDNYDKMRFAFDQLGSKLKLD